MAEKSTAQNKQTIKCMVVGDCTAEKTALLTSYVCATKNLQIEDIPIGLEKYPVTVMTGGQSCTLELSDLSGAEDYDRLRPLNYGGTDVFLICFSVVKPASFTNVKKMWVPEINFQCPETPFLIVGTQSELRHDTAANKELAMTKQKPITFEEGMELAREVRAAQYLECSAETQNGLRNVFDEAILAALDHEPPPENPAC